ncbi:MAG: hypothetical protein WBG70_07780 [Spirulinaceae cyanobacterium]
MSSSNFTPASSQIPPQAAELFNQAMTDMSALEQVAVTEAYDLVSIHWLMLLGVVALS